MNESVNPGSSIHGSVVESRQETLPPSSQPVNAPRQRTVVQTPCLTHGKQHSVIHLDDVTRLALMVTPQPQGPAHDQAREAIATIQAILKQQPLPMNVTKQTVFVRSADDIPTFQKLFELGYGDWRPATSFIVQPPCDGAALSIEAWALGGHGVEIQFPMPDVVTAEYDGLRWIYVGGIRSPEHASSAYEESEYCFSQLAERLEKVDAKFDDVSRIWLYQNGITESEPSDETAVVERYRELNRARTDFFERQQSLGRMGASRGGHSRYPASTGIGMSSGGLSVSCLGLQTKRDDVFLQSLENPRQTPAFDYAQRYSAKSPKFSRAMAVKIGDHVTTWISGTASILDSESVHLEDVEKQTEQTIDNIQSLIGEQNFGCHGLPGMGAELGDLAKVRVYVKRPADFEKCRTICQARLGDVPTIYAFADVCRPDLLVEIEGVAFSNISQSSRPALNR